ncbi:tetratricopeptide repeat protein, partial [Chryseobacterium sp. IT-36CA2]|uniref:tetratricopeptide repeat protein n=1 Tax=Chryseobacterium sp. IT-36CA2 TaxID=3026460 RepID=UPI0039E0720A
MVRSLLILSEYYFNIGVYGKAIQYAKQTEKEASNINDYKSMCVALRIAAVSNYTVLGFDKEAQIMINRAFSIADKISDPDDLYQTKGDLYRAKGDMAYYSHTKNSIPDFFKYAKKALTEFSKIRNIKTRNNSFGEAYSDLGLVYVEKKMFDSAYHYMNASLNLARNDKNYYNECIALNGLVYASSMQKNYQQTINYLETLIPLSKRTNQPVILKLAYQSMQASYNHLGNKEKELEYLAKYTKLSDSLAGVDKLMKEVSIKKMVEEKEATFINEKDKLYLFIAVICLLSALTWCFGYKAFRKYKLEKKEKQLKENVIKEKESQLTEIQQKLNYAFDEIVELEKKEKQLKENVIKEKESQLTEMQQKVNNSFEEIVELAKKDDPSFLTRFAEVNPDFIQKLNRTYPKLTSGQLKFCALLRLNFSTKEIAYYTHISDRSVEIKKGRLRKRLGIPSSADINNWMINFL